MGRGIIGVVLSVARILRRGVWTSDIKLNPGPGANLTGQHVAPPGDDSQPLPGDYLFATPNQQTGRVVVVGYVDPDNAPASQPGEKRVYSRDLSGAVKVELFLKNDGTAVLVNSGGSVTLTPAGAIIGQNSAGAFELEPGGDFVVNGVTIGADGAVNVPASLTLAGKEIAGHDHNISGGSSAPGPTGPNN